jgi:nitroimidazol reductase NimA-like FMN-containing flavoprotein (pyridoxamine 5'-phosphate oxidase superfamily)
VTAPAPRRAPEATRVRRLPEKQVRDRSTLDAVLDTALAAHVGFVDDGGFGDGARPVVVPMGIARDRDDLLVHGSTASRAMRALAAGVPVCVTVTVLDGVVVARSRFESSMQYRCAMIFGSFEVLHGPDKSRGLEVLSQRLLPGVTGQREPSPKELAATAVLSLSIVDGTPGRAPNWSLKISSDGPDDAAADRDLPVWAGVVPLRHSWGTPRPAPDLPDGIAVPPTIGAWARGRT